MKPSAELSLFDFCLVHATRHAPLAAEDGVALRTTAQAGSQFRPTVHFALNHHVTAHGFGDWDDAPYVIIAPYADTVNRNAGHATLESLNPADTYFTVVHDRPLHMPGAHVVRPGRPGNGALIETAGNTTVYKDDMYTMGDLGRMRRDPQQQETMERLRTLLGTRVAPKMDMYLAVLEARGGKGTSLYDGPDLKLKDWLRDEDVPGKTARANDILRRGLKHDATIQRIKAAGFEHMPGHKTEFLAERGDHELRDRMQVLTKLSGARHGRDLHLGTPGEHLENVLTAALRQYREPDPDRKLEFDHVRENVREEHLLGHSHRDIIERNGSFLLPGHLGRKLQAALNAVTDPVMLRAAHGFITAKKLPIAYNPDAKDRFSVGALHLETALIPSATTMLKGSAAQATPNAAAAIAAKALMRRQSSLMTP